MSGSEQRDAALMCGTRWTRTCVRARRVLHSKTTGSAVAGRYRAISYKRTFYRPCRNVPSAQSFKTRWEVPSFKGLMQVGNFSLHTSQITCTPKNQLQFLKNW